jgi:hypothetical protein
MFLPSRSVNEEKQIRTAAYKQIEAICLALLPPAMVPDCIVSAQEVQCGDPNCAPIDTMITLQFLR